MTVLWRYLTAAGAAVAAVAVIWLRGRSEGRQAAAAEYLQREAQARKRADDAASQYRADGGAVERLRRGDF